MLGLSSDPPGHLPVFTSVIARLSPPPQGKVWLPRPRMPFLPPRSHMANSWSSFNTLLRIPSLGSAAWFLLPQFLLYAILIRHRGGDAGPPSSLDWP